jgi:hypothetical protein
VKEERTGAKNGINNRVEGSHYGFVVGALEIILPLKIKGASREKSRNICEGLQ